MTKKFNYEQQYYQHSEMGKELLHDTQGIKERGTFRQAKTENIHLLGKQIMSMQ